MKGLWSRFAFRLAVASVMWTIGLLYVAHLLSVFVMFGPEALARFGGAMVPSTMIAAGLMVGGARIVRRALETFTLLQSRLLDVHEGRERVVAGAYMREVQPVVATLNGLLEHQERRVRDALTKAGDLAHGLKTPLAVLTHEADRAAAAGHHELASVMRDQIARMRRHIDYHLAHARAAASGATPGARCAVEESVRAIARTLERLHAQRGITVLVTVPERHVARVRREDLDEMLGNLLDNACKWARSQVVVTSTLDGPRIILAVDDDGPGIAAAERDAVLQRGVRLDEGAPGSGFGLAIVRDLADLYGGGITLGVSPHGGLSARLQLPAADEGNNPPMKGLHAR